MGEKIDNNEIGDLRTIRPQMPWVCVCVCVFTHVQAKPLIVFIQTSSYIYTQILFSTLWETLRLHCWPCKLAHFNASTFTIPDNNIFRFHYLDAWQDATYYFKFEFTSEKPTDSFTHMTDTRLLLGLVINYCTLHCIFNFCLIKYIFVYRGNAVLPLKLLP